MNKPFYRSMTFWGAILLGVSTALGELGASYPVLVPIAQGLGTVLAVFGFRRAIK